MDRGISEVRLLMKTAYSLIQALFEYLQICYRLPSRRGMMKNHNFFQ